MQLRKAIMVSGLVAVIASCSRDPIPQEPGPSLQEDGVASRARSEAVVEEALPIRDSEAAPPHVDAVYVLLAKRIREEPERNRDEALFSIRRELRTIDAKIDSLDLRTRLLPGKLDDSTQARREASLRLLRQRRSSVEHWFQAMQPGASEPWNHATEEFATAFLKLGQAVDQADQVFEADS